MILAFPIMRIRRFKNQIIRALVFCILGSLFVAQITYYQDAMGVFGAGMFTISFYLIFNSEKMINLAHSKRYRFSLLRQVFNYESFIYSKLPERFKKFSVAIAALIVVTTFSLYIGDPIFIFVCVPLLAVLSFY
jgi:hypothetical protein